MPLILGANSLAGGYQIKNSARFNSASTDYLNRTFSTPTNNKIWTWSCWIKRATLGQNFFFVSRTTANSMFQFTSGDKLSMADVPVSTYNYRLQTTQVFRDVSAWYHILLSVDTTQATSSNRLKLYVNGSQITSFEFETQPTQNFDTDINSANVHRIGTYDASSSLGFNGYMSEFNFIDGQALTPSSFGETDTDTGIWKPKAYTGTFGTNGFYLDFEDSANLGNDMSGNNNDFTVNNLTSIDQTTDTPTNNFATINTLTCNDTATLTSADGNLTITGGNDMGATIGITKGKWYWESKRSNTGTVAHWGIGFTQSWYSSTQIVTGNGSGYFFRNDFVGGLSVSNSGSNGFTDISTSSTGSSVANGDIIGVALDLDSATKSVTFYQNGSQVASATFSYDGTSSTCFPFIRNNSGAQSQWNFGNPPFTIASGNADANGYGNFEYAVPSGYYALCTKNLVQFG